jgi:signal transduction histidine kinase
MMMDFTSTGKQREMNAQLSAMPYPPQGNVPEWFEACKKAEKTVREKILVVDDENGPRQALRMLLNGDYEVHLASSVSDALEMLKTLEIDLVITDIRMPQQSGVDLLRMAKEIRPELQVILLTGYAHLDTAMKAVEYGAFVYLEKPFDNDLMLRHVRAGLDKSRQERERKVMEQLAIEANRFETLGRLVSGMMHDMGTPLSVIGSQIEMIMNNPHRDDMMERLGTMHGQVRHCSDMVRCAMNFLRHDTSGSAPFCLNNVTEMCLEVARPVIRNQSVRVATNFAPDLSSCMGDLVLVRQAVLNLITNACHAMMGQKEVRELRLNTWVEDGFAHLSVEDTGPGVPLENREKIFETFFTTKGEMGTGLGLAVVKNVMRRHKGSVTLGDESGRGAKFVLRFPLATTEDVLHLFRQAQDAPIRLV